MSNLLPHSWSIFIVSQQGPDAVRGGRERRKYESKSNRSRVQYVSTLVTRRGAPRPKVCKPSTDQDRLAWNSTRTCQHLRSYHDGQYWAFWGNTDVVRKLVNFCATVYTPFSIAPDQIVVAK